MKRTIYALCTALCALFVIVSCSKSDDGQREVDFLQERRDIIPDRLLEEMKNKGMQINEGDNPPDIQGIFQTSKFVLIYTNMRADTLGKKYDAYRYKFYEQNGVKLKADRADKDNPEDTNAAGKGAIISGSGNKFTLFLKIEGVTLKVPNKEAHIVSGEITPEGIKNLQMGFCMVEKNDPKGKLVPEGGIRVFNTESGLAVRKQKYPTGD